MYIVQLINCLLKCTMYNLFMFVKVYNVQTVLTVPVAMEQGKDLEASEHNNQEPSLHFPCP